MNPLSAVYHALNQSLADVYIEMLHAGERLGHKELLKLFNLYASGGNFWAKALFMIDSVINELDNKK